MIKNMQKFWRDCKLKNLAHQSNPGRVGSDLKSNPPDNQGSFAPVSKKQRILSRKVLARDGSTSSCEKAKILAQINPYNNDKTWRNYEEIESLISSEGEWKSTKYA